MRQKRGKNLHIAEGVLSLPVLAAGASVAAAGTAYGIRKLPFEAVPRCGIVSAALFVASLIHINLGVSSAHLVLNGLGGLFLGWSLFPACLVALLLQAVLFQFGGLVVLGVNASVMAGPGVLAGLFARYLLSRQVPPLLCGFIAGAGGVIGAAVAVAGALIFEGEAFRATALLLVGANIPIALIEGVVTAFIVVFLSRTAPGFLGNRKARRSDTR